MRNETIFSRRAVLSLVVAGCLLGPTSDSAKETTQVAAYHKAADRFAASFGTEMQSRPSLT